MRRDEGERVDRSARAAEQVDPRAAQLGPQGREDGVHVGSVVLRRRGRVGRAPAATGVPGVVGDHRPVLQGPGEGGEALGRHRGADQHQRRRGLRRLGQVAPDVVGQLGAGTLRVRTSALVRLGASTGRSLPLVRVTVSTAGAQEGHRALPELVRSRLSVVVRRPATRCRPPRVALPHARAAERSRRGPGGRCPGSSRARPSRAGCATGRPLAQGCVPASVSTSCAGARSRPAGPGWPGRSGLVVRRVFAGDRPGRGRAARRDGRCTRTPHQREWPTCPGVGGALSSPCSSITCSLVPSRTDRPVVPHPPTTPDGDGQHFTHRGHLRTGCDSAPGRLEGPASYTRRAISGRRRTTRGTARGLVSLGDR